MDFDAMRERIRTGKGFIAALDQSGGSSPKALKLYGVEEDRYASEEEMFDLIHAMRERIVTSDAFTGDRVIGAILFEQTMDRTFDGRPAPEYLWKEKGIVPFLKVDKGLEEAGGGVQMMKDMGDLEGLLGRARDAGVFGTKMRSVIGGAGREGIARNVAQQFEVGERIRAAGLVPILEPEVTITIPDKAEAEAMLREEIERALDALPEGAEVMLKLSLPSEDGFYADLIRHPKVLRVVALSGGYARDEANALLARNPGMIASFSRGLTEGLTDGMDDAAFDAALGRALDDIAAASAA
ncbi:fructose-bisphosphate aldolase [Hasllibacter halocynthiae]|uniref:fructose-bisphosphate aldolase n=1 Tax=Hasllibacter halocynthiae TaxID=595589 RepID=A0A2T0X8V7_9RHOB|nr:fructose bisphosphate aldolase [Hasllibacter halocynthiae]PRY95345.1 fructose-bisphosphate aldolase [Hasllibacter halocynthiae]